MGNHCREHGQRGREGYEGRLVRVATGAGACKPHHPNRVKIAKSTGNRLLRKLRPLKAMRHATIVWHKPSRASQAYEKSSRLLAESFTLWLSVGQDVEVLGLRQGEGDPKKPLYLPAPPPPM